MNLNKRSKFDTPLDKYSEMIEENKKKGGKLDNAMLSNILKDMDANDILKPRKPPSNSLNPINSEKSIWKSSESKKDQELVASLNKRIKDLETLVSAQRHEIKEKTTILCANENQLLDLQKSISAEDILRVQKLEANISEVKTKVEDLESFLKQ